MPPYWSLGFQLCRWGYKSLKQIELVINRTRDARIPHDVQYVDIDYMNEYKDFTVDTVNFKGLSEFFQKKQNEGLKVVLILDPVLAVEPNYSPFENGIKRAVYIKWPSYMAPFDDDLYSDYMIS